MVMKFSPSEVFIPCSIETLLQCLPLVAYEAVSAGVWVVEGSRRPCAGGTVDGMGVEGRQASERE